MFKQFVKHPSTNPRGCSFLYGVLFCNANKFYGRLTRGLANGVQLRYGFMLSEALPPIGGV